MSNTDNVWELLAAYRLPVLAFALAVIASAAAWLSRDRRLDKIPGPRGWPFIGIGLSLPTYYPRILREWGHQYGELFKMRVGWHNWVVVNSPEAFKEIFDKQASITSSKLPQPMGDGVLSRGMRMFTLPYGPKWRAYRNINHQLLSSTMTATFVPAQEFETKQLLFDLATDNADQLKFRQHIRRFSFGIISTSTYGTRINRWDHPDVDYSGRASNILGRLSRAGSFIVDELPFLAKLPEWLQPGRKMAEDVSIELLEVKMAFWRRLKEHVAAGKAPPCYAREVLENEASWRKKGLVDEDAAWVVGGIVEVGSHTSSTTLLHMTRYLAQFPKAQKDAHDELMRVVGPNRTPTYEDIENLPFIRSCLKEILRLCPTPILGIRHYTDGDVVYKDYVIPKGTVVLANTMAMHYDPSRYEDPYSFKPERYLKHTKYSADYAVQGDPYDRDHFTFGGGRRICPGTRLAENTINISLANLLWAFEIKPPIVNGVEQVGMDLSDDSYESTSFRGSKPYAVRFVPRSQDRVDLIKKQWAEAQKAGYMLRGMHVDNNGITG